MDAQACASLLMLGLTNLSNVVYIKSGMEGDGIVDGVAKEPSRKLVAEWVVEVYNSIPEEIGQNSWKRKGYKWV